MPVNARFLAARAAERHRRDLAHLGALGWITLRRDGRPLLRTPLVPLTTRHELALGVERNAFFDGRRPLPADLHLLLYRLHPDWAPVRPGREGAVADLARARCRLLRQWWATGSLAAALAHRRLARAARRCDLGAAVAAVRAYLDAALQDAPRSAGRRRRTSLAAPPRHAADNLTDWLMTTYGMSHAAALDFPVALGHQLYRERRLQAPDGILEVSDPSDDLLSP